jgi:hypothetical protein
MTFKSYLNRVHFPPKHQDEKEIPETLVTFLLQNDCLSPLRSDFRRLFVFSDIPLIQSSSLNIPYHLQFQISHPRTGNITLAYQYHRFHIHHNIHLKFPDFHMHFPLDILHSMPTTISPSNTKLSRPGAEEEVRSRK